MVHTTYPSPFEWPLPSPALSEQISRKSPSPPIISHLDTWKEPGSRAERRFPEQGVEKPTAERWGRRHILASTPSVCRAEGVSNLAKGWSLSMPP